MEEDLAGRIGLVEEREGALEPALAGMLGAALGHAAAPVPETRTGAPMPPLWHWAAFPEFVPPGQLGTDGHPRLGRFLPDTGLPRRMWAGGRVTFEGALRVGEPLGQRAAIASIDEKTGAAGRMVFVRVDRETTGAAGRVTESQDIVYLPMPDEWRAPRKVPGFEAPEIDETVTMDAVRLFRYSAATFNAHRIHYDLPYAREVETYPDLVVHGPMQATLLLEAAARRTGRRPAAFRFRGVHPIFAPSAMRLTGRPAGDGWELATVAAEGHQGMTASVEWAT